MFTIMKRSLTIFLLSSFVVSTLIASEEPCPQLPNSGFEQWEQASAKESESMEPVGFNSFWTASAKGIYAAAIGKQIEESSEVRPGTTGTKSVKIFSREVLKIPANGNLTTGRIYAGDGDPLSELNHNKTFRSSTNTLFSKAYTARPDSLIAWIKFAPVDPAHQGRVSAVIHGDFDFKEPSTDATNNSYIVGKAVEEFAATQGEWVRLAVPFVYDGPSNDPQYLLLTFTTNKTPGVGTVGDYLLIDDLELKYKRTTALSTISSSRVEVYPNPVVDRVVIKGDRVSEAQLFAVTGQVVWSGKVESNEIDLTSISSGVYTLVAQSASGVVSAKLIKQ